MPLTRTFHSSFLAYVDLLGTTYTASTIATGYGAYIAQPLLREAVEGKEDTLTEEQAQRIMEESLKVLFYRDARSLNKVSPHENRFTGNVFIVGLSIKSPRSLLVESTYQMRYAQRQSGILQRRSEVMELRHNR